jgi:excinuclease ABC subunit A
LVRSISQLLPTIGSWHGQSIQDSTGQAVKDLSAKQIETILYGNGGERFKIEYTNSYGEKRDFHSAFEGIVNNLARRYAETRSDASREDLEKYVTSSPCQRCQGKRLREEILWVLLGSKSIAEVSSFSIRESLEFFTVLQLNERDMTIARQVIKEIKTRLGFLMDVGLDYLTLDRAAGSLSGGEAQRIRLATQVGSSLMGVLYVLDEPSIGLHPRDNDRLLATLKRLRDLGNTVIVVEHDEETMHNADFIVDIGPGAGVHGGEVVAAGSLDDIIHSEDSLTGQYLSGQRDIAVPLQRRPGNGHELIIRGAREHNLKDIDVSIPLGKMVVVTGVSGSGKSTLIEDILYPALMKKYYGGRHKPGQYKEMIGAEYLEKVIIYRPVTDWKDTALQSGNLYRRF